MEQIVDIKDLWCIRCYWWMGIGQTLGLIEQRRWKRRAASHGKKHQRTQRAYKEKESYKWEHASRVMSERLGELMSRTISVCDRASVCLRSIDVISRRARIVPTATASYGHRLCKNIKGRSATRRSRLNGAGLLRRGFEPAISNYRRGLITL